MRKNGSNIPQFNDNNNLFYNKDYLISHITLKRFLTKNELFLFLYVNDSASTFFTRKVAILGTDFFSNR